jgi:hypothetical protein
MNPELGNGFSEAMFPRASMSRWSISQYKARTKSRWWTRWAVVGRGRPRAAGRLMIVGGLPSDGS